MRHFFRTNQRNHPTYAALFSGCILLAAFFCQLSYPAHVDILWLTHVAKLLSAGGHYLTDFIALNAPASTLIYEPINWLHALLPYFSINTITFLYIYILIALSVWRCHRLPHEDNSLPLLLGPLTALLLTCLPLSEQGERECLTIALSMPYLIGTLSQIHQNKPHYCNTSLAIIGFLVRMKFMVIPILVECFLWHQRKRPRWQLFAFLAAALAYIAYVFICIPAYWQQIIPFAQHYYFYHFHRCSLLSSTLAIPIIAITTGMIMCTLSMKQLKNSRYLPLLITMLVSLSLFLLLEQSYGYQTLFAVTCWTLLTALLMHQAYCMHTTKLPTKYAWLFVVNIIALIVTLTYQVHKEILIGKGLRSYHTPHWIQRHAKRIMPLTMAGYPTMLETVAQNKISCSRFVNLWMFPGIQKGSQHAKETLRHWIVTDVKRCHPDTIVITRSVLDFFLADPSFKDSMSHFTRARRVHDRLYFVRDDP